MHFFDFFFKSRVPSHLLTPNIEVWKLYGNGKAFEPRVLQIDEPPNRPGPNVTFLVTGFLLKKPIFMNIVFVCA